MKRLNYMAAALASGGANRRENDFYPTPSDVTHSLLRFLGLSPITVWEPACGNGAISSVLTMYGHKVVSTDLNDYGFGEPGVDYLKTIKPGIDAIITNPPFFIAADFIKKAIGEADIVCMLLKCQYWHSKTRLKLFHEMIPAYILPLTWRPNFTDGKNSPMDLCWTVWIKGNHECRYVPLTRDTGTIPMFKL